jgi:hypothetical protein
MRLTITQRSDCGSPAFTAVGLSRRVRESWVLARVTQAPIHMTARETDP